MTQKMLLTIELDDAALDTAQAKADKLIATIKEAEERMERLQTCPKETHALFAEATNEAR